MIRLSIALYVMQLLLAFAHFRQIFVDIKDMFFNEFSWFANGDSNLDVMTSKIREATSAKHINSNFLALLTICGLLFALAVVSVTSSSDEINFVLNDTGTIAMNLQDDTSLSFSEPNSSLTNRVNTNDEPTNSRNIFRKSPSPGKGFLTPRGFLESPEIQILSARDSQLNVNMSQHSHKTQTSERFLQKSENSHEWLVRCTRRTVPHIESGKIKTICIPTRSP